jgi:hypothetical protein
MLKYLNLYGGREIRIGDYVAIAHNSIPNSDAGSSADIYRAPSSSALHVIGQAREDMGVGYTLHEYSIQWADEEIPDYLDLTIEGEKPRLQTPIWMLDLVIPQNVQTACDCGDTYIPLFNVAPTGSYYVHFECPSCRRQFEATW